jgi:hypothetical protein
MGSLSFKHTNGELKLNNTLRVNAELKYIEHLLHVFDTANETMTMAQVRQDFIDKFSTGGPLLNQHFGLLRFLPLMMIKEIIKEKKEQSEDAKRIKIIRDSIAHNDFLIDETGYTFRDEKCTTKVTLDEHPEFLHRIENEFYAKHC